MDKGSRRRMGSIDLDTGEIFEQGIPVWVGAKVKWREDWFMGFQEAFKKVSEDPEINPEMTRVWLNLLSRLGFENWVAVPQVEIAKDLNMQRANVSRAIRGLLQKELLIRGPKLGRTSAYKLNSNYAWKGKIRNLCDERMGIVKDFKMEKEKREKNK